MELLERSAVAGFHEFKVKLGYRKHKQICAELQEIKVFEMMGKLL